MDEITRPPRYEIHIRGALSETMLGAFPKLQASVRGSVTVLTGDLPDQSALHGVLAQVQALHLELLRVQRREPAATAMDRPDRVTTAHPTDVEIAETGQAPP